MKPYKTAVIVFRRDLRLQDNKALNAALEMSEKVVCLFVVDPAFNHREKKKILAKKFLLATLKQLDGQLQKQGGKLHLLSGEPDKEISLFVSRISAEAVFINREYTVKGIYRDSQIEESLKSQGINLYSYDDALLFPPGFILKKDGTPYTIFTPFYNKAKQFPIESVAELSTGNIIKVKNENTISWEQLAAYWQIDSKMNDNFCDSETLLGGVNDLEHYADERDYPYLGATSKLSTHLKFGVLSPRQAWWHIEKNLGSDHPLLRQLYWRDFFSHIGFHFPHVFTHSFRNKYRNLPWINNFQYFDAWCEGKTGFPIVDAGMRELNETGIMHNRVRMIVASFLVKDLLIDWRWGERYFSDHLIDYDSAVNNGNWQWAASTGCDAQPYFRIFNPWLQQKKFDKTCLYIKKWVPELASKTPSEIHNWGKHIEKSDYPNPIVDHSICSKQAKEFFALAQ